MSDRHTKMNQELQHQIATYVQLEANSDPMITITKVVTTPDLKKAAVYFTTLPDNREDDAMIFLRRSASDMRNYLRKKSKIGRLPHLDFYLDAGEKHRQHIDDLVRETGTEISELADDIK